MAKKHLNPEDSGEILLEDEVREPHKYKVLLHNDDYTSMEFVVHVLMKIFRKSLDEATTIMLSVHESGLGVCGIYTFEIAHAKVMQVRFMAREAGFPLLCTSEKAEG